MRAEIRRISPLFAPFQAEIPMPKIFTQFQIEPDGGHYRLQFTLHDGTKLEVVASFEQLDLLAEEIDRRLDADQD